jgi:two-component system, OmpR family, sensor histidine kinase SenX3
MRIASPNKAIAFFITFGAVLVLLAVGLNVGWIVLNWRRDVALVLGVIFFGAIITGLVLNTIFLVREIRRNEQQDSFLNAVTHELKTPVASIRLYLETLERRQLDEAQRREFYGVMLQDTDRLLGTIEQVLQAGEARQGRLRAKWREVDFGVIVKDAIDSAILRNHLPDGVLRFSTPPAEELLVRGNAEQLSTAVGNLLDNAIKYSGDKPDIVVRLRTPNLDTIALSVKDRGIGIPRNELSRIFKRFYRAHPALPGPAGARKIKGTGLGLFIVRSVVRQHGGEASAESDGPGTGSTFRLRLPRVYRA